MLSNKGILDLSMTGQPPDDFRGNRGTELNVEHLRDGRGSGRSDNRGGGRGQRQDNYRGRGGYQEDRGGNRGGRNWEGNRDNSQQDSQRPDPAFKGQGDGSMVAKAEIQRPAVIEKSQKTPVAGLEIKPQKNRSAELIRELGNVSFPIKTLCVYLSRCFKVGDNETSDVMVEKFRLTEKFNELREISDELIKIITSREAKPSVDGLQTQ